MLYAVRGLALFLNQYASLLLVLSNFLLVLITAIYAWLTWRTLGALRQASLREREARHLQEIKDSVIRPVVSWIIETVLDRFTGRTPELLVVSGGYDGKPRQLTHTIDDPFNAMRHLSTPADPDVPDPLATWTSTAGDRISEFLYDHVKQNHFRGELEDFDRLVEGVRGLTAAFVSLANEWAKEIGEHSTIQCPRPDGSVPSPEETEFPHQLVADCVRSLLQNGQVPPIQVQDLASNPKLYEVRLGGSNLVARGAEQHKLKQWCELALARVRKGWEGGDLPTRVRNILREAQRVRGRMERPLFTHSLGVDCDLVGGKRPRPS